MSAYCAECAVKATYDRAGTLVIHHRSSCPMPTVYAAAEHLTPARERGLRVLTITGYADYSNRTVAERRGDFGGRIYWQTADWLIDNGLAKTPDRRPTDTQLQITRAGQLLAEYVWPGR